MKKALAVLLAVLLCAFIFPSSAFSFKNEEHTEYTEATVPKSFKESDVKLGENALRELGMSEKWIQRVPDEKKVAFAYSKGYKNSEDDKYFHKELYVTEKKGDRDGAYDIIAIFQWKNMSLYRGTDAISISGDNLVFDMSSFNAEVFYDYTYLQGNQYRTEAHREAYNMNNLSYNNDLQLGTNKIMFRYNLPNDIKIPNGNNYIDATNQNLEFMVTVTSYISLLDFKTVFNVQADYYHQKFPYAEIDVTASSDYELFGLFYTDNKIMMEDAIIYEP